MNMPAITVKIAMKRNICGMVSPKASSRLAPTAETTMKSELEMLMQATTPAMRDSSVLLWMMAYSGTM